MICFDGNFQHQHDTKARKDEAQDEKYPDCFIKPSVVKAHEDAVNSTNSQAKKLQSSCSESHTAANDVHNTKTFQILEDAGLFGCSCWHDAPLKFVKIYKTDEKLYYPISILEEIMHDFPDTLPRYLYRMGLSDVLSPRDMRCSVSRIRCDGITLQYGVRALDT
ncbi:hypothetical protein CROQUDRAFT_675262, partial [Cronartium quercuum f. sp. fusiforme G11]